MIEINLVPDVKQELIRAQRIRASVISLAILVGIVSVGVVVLFAFWVFAVQTARGIISDGTIKNESEKLAKVQDVSNTLTIQNQLSILPGQHDSKSVDSRIFEILKTINPSEPNSVAITNLSLDSETKTIKIEAQAANGYPALDVFKKTINATKFTYTQDGQAQTEPLANDMSDSDRSYGEDATGAKVLRFTLTFTYPDLLFSRSAKNAKIDAPERSNATDSYQGVPKSLFTQKASDVSGEGN